PGPAAAAPRAKAAPPGPGAQPGGGVGGRGEPVQPFPDQQLDIVVHDPSLASPASLDLDVTGRRRRCACAGRGPAGAPAAWAGVASPFWPGSGSVPGQLSASSRSRRSPFEAADLTVPSEQPSTSAASAALHCSPYRS